jgi:tetrahedral aminopeptidase
VGTVGVARRLDRPISGIGLVGSETVNFDLLKRLCETSGIASREDRVRDLVAAELRPLVDDLRIDAMGNLVGRKAGSGGPRVMIAAHMDEIGFLVKHVDDNGFLRIHPVGGFDPRVLVAQRVRVHTADGRSLLGVVQPAAKPIHLLDPSEMKPLKLEELFVDVGLPAEKAKAAVEIGDMVTLDRTVEVVGENVIGKALDDRAGVYIMIEAIRAMRGGSAEILAVATTQEEVGLRGAHTSAYELDPQITLAADIPGMPTEQAVSRLGKGPAIKLMDSSHLSHPKLVRHFRDLADRHEISYQLELLPRGGTDAGAMQMTRAGVPAITLSLPTRYVHTVNEMANQTDLDACVTLLARFLDEAGTRDYGYQAS